ncbi:MAG TPA: urate hydroxylase PuuD [Polyangia bacterium]
MFEDPSSLVNVVLRFGHIVFGIIWLGHLYFLNLVNVPLQADLDKDVKPLLNPKLLLRVFYWFRMGAMYTFIFGWLLFGYKYGHQKLLMVDGALTTRGMWILFGGIIGTIMWANVWFVIWPRQKLILGGLAAGKPHPDAATMAATALKASRFNLFASGPMLFGMIMPNNDPGRSPLFMIFALILGVGFWFGLIKRSFKIKTTVP